MDIQTNLGSLYHKTKKRLSDGGIENPGLEASVILCSVIEKPPHTVHTEPDKVIGTDAVRKCEDRVRRRLEREPCAYTTGFKEFFSLRFEVNPAVLIPRPETETLVEEALKILKRGGGKTVLDVGTGSGCIAVVLKKHMPRLRVCASDISPGALEVARANARRHLTKISFVLGDGLSCFEDGCADLVVSNPPYVSAREMEELPAEVGEFEPPGALFGGEDGFEHIRGIVSSSPRVLRKNGWCLIEVGEGQADGCAEIFKQNGFGDITTARDLAGKTRTVGGTWKK